MIIIIRVVDSYHNLWFAPVPILHCETKTQQYENK